MLQFSYIHRMSRKTRGNRVVPQRFPRNRHAAAAKVPSEVRLASLMRRACLANRGRRSVEPIADRDLPPDDHVAGLRSESLEVGGLEVRLERRLVVVDLVKEEAVAPRVRPADVEAAA